MTTGKKHKSNGSDAPNNEQPTTQLEAGSDEKDPPKEHDGSAEGGANEALMDTYNG